MKIAVIGLGYVGLPVALAFAREYPGTVGFDVDLERIRTLASGNDWTGEASADELTESSLIVTSDPNLLRDAKVYIVCVPTPVHPDHRPDFGPLTQASQIIGSVLGTGDVVVYESTVYPGVTEEVCGPILAKTSGLKQGVDFKLGYSPERINPGDRDHKFQSIVKVVAGEDEKTTGLLSTLYGRVVSAGVHVTPSIKVAECAKVLENSQRDINVALMNELAIICDLLNIRTRDVLDAAVTKWNFLKFSPGLVGGHCIGVDPYYLTAKAIELGYHPEVILSGRRVNDSMGPRIAQRLVKLLAQSSLPLSKTKVGILGLTFKENVPDIRNSRVPDIIDELRQFGISVEIVDPHVDSRDVLQKLGFTMTTLDQLDDLDALVLAVPHKVFLDKKKSLMSRLKPGGVLIDIKSVFAQSEVPPDIRHWSL